ncbi:type II secretion system protein [Candidatus Dojkabacteria bacterium]|nr:type II secretion system protein [Candidatus Dojkabacteria bacterium]
MIKTLRKFRREEGFTLVELLVVMAIIAVLIAISVAGLGFAMRRSRNIARESAVANIERALSAYYADSETYPNPTNVGNVNTLAQSTLKDQLEGSWDPGPPNTEYYYATTNDILLFVICVNQETNTANNYDYYCTGPGMGQIGSTSSEANYDNVPLSGVTQMISNKWCGDDTWVGISASCP